jgi:4-amino-4-deoxy-L-arabinose transferase-like glycosyltransferase
LSLPGLLILAAAFRFIALPERGTWDLDQGRDLLTLRSLLVDGAFPLLGPPTSVGGTHHGAAYYYLLAPFAALGGLDPAFVAVAPALAGVAAVGLVWWLARSIGGAAAGFAAGLLQCASPSAIAASVTIWNPSLATPAAALSLAAAWRAWTCRQPRWWFVAIVAAGVAAQLHLVASILAIPVAALFVADLRRGSTAYRRRLALVGSSGVVVAAFLWVPLLAHELSSGFAELRAALDFLGTDRGPADVDVATRLVVSTYRMASWPIVGLMVDAPVAASVVAGLVIGIAVWRSRAAIGHEATGTRWLVGTMGLSAIALTVISPDLAVIVPGLPNDQYHAATDPIVPILFGLAVGGLVGRRNPVVGSGESRTLLGRRLLGVALLVGLVATELLRFPPLRDPDGGWPAARAAAERVLRTAADRTLLVVGVPTFKPADGLVYPLRMLGARVVSASATPGALVVTCDRLFEPAIGARCGGEAERDVERQHPGLGRLADRFDLSPRTAVSVYLPALGP